MDFITHLPLVSGYDAIFSIIDRFSKYCCFLPINGTITADKLAHLFFDNWVCKYGMPKSIVSDRDPKFTSRFWSKLVALLGCK